MQTAKEMSEQVLKNLEEGIKELREALEASDANSPVQNLLISQKISELISKKEAIENFRKTMGWE